MTSPTRRAGAPAEPPAEALPRAALLAGAGSGAITVLALRLQPLFGLGTGFPIRVGAIAAGMMLVALTGFRDHHPFARVGAANVVTGVRALILALLAGVAFEPALGPLRWWIAGTAAAGATLDLADGWLARRSKLASAFGARFDLEVDALLILVLSVLVWRSGVTGSWVLMSGLMRYLFVAAAQALPWLNRALPASRRRQAICVVQIVALIAALAPVVPASAAVALAGGSLALLTWSFAADVAWLFAARRS
ncbi:MAG: CDP-alcohol phosphatidyltransferase family protein [Acidobacteriota bacterium]